VDTDEAKIAKLKRGESPIYEPYLMEIVELAALRGGIEFSTDVGPAVAASDVFSSPSEPRRCQRRTESGIS